MGSKKNNRGYGRVTNKAMKLMFARGKDLNRTDKFIFFTLIVKQGASTEAQIANNKLAVIADLNIRSVQRSIDKLFSCGLIKIKAQSVYEINPEYLYKRGEGFGKVYFDVLTADLSIYAKLLYVVNTVASGKDGSNNYKREKLMAYINISKHSYYAAMDELNHANVIGQNRNYRQDSIGNIKRTTNNKFSLPRENYELTHNQLKAADRCKSDKTRTQDATIEGHKKRQKEDLINDKTRTAYQEPLSRTIITNHYHEPTTADSSNRGASPLYSYQEFFRRGFNPEVLDGYENEDIEKAVTLFAGIRKVADKENWTISEKDFTKLSSVLMNIEGYESKGISVEHFSEFIRDVLIPDGRKGKSLSYWLSDGILAAYMGHVNAQICGLTSPFEASYSMN